MAEGLFRGLRRDIAVALNGRKLTLYETSKALGLRSGDIQKALRQMVDEGVLIPSDPEPVRGTLFWLSEKHVEALEEALRVDQAPGAVAQHQTLLLLRAPSNAALNAVLSKADLTAPVSWAARGGSGKEMLLAIAPEPDVGELGRLETALEGAGILVETCTVAAVMDPKTLRSTFSSSAATGARALA